MSYVGQGPGLKTTNIKRFDVTGSTSATHVLSWTAPSEQTLWITINGVKQQDDAYTIAGSPTTITLSSALVATDKMEVIGVVDMGVSTYPVDGSVSTASLGNSSVTTDKIAAGAVGTTDIADDAVTLEKQAAGTQGGTIYYGAAGAPKELAAGTSGQFLKTQGAGQSPVWGSVTEYNDGGLQDDIALLGFKVAANGSLAKYNLVDQTVDDFQDATGVDAGASANVLRNTSGKYYGGTTPITATVSGNYDTTGTDGDYSWYKWTTATSAGSYTTDIAQEYEYLVIAGGGGGGDDVGSWAGGGGGAGGYRTGQAFPVAATTIGSITVGAGGAADTNGANSVFSTITSAGGGGGGTKDDAGTAGGSGGGGGASAAGGAGNTPSTSPVQGYGGGTGSYSTDGNYAGGGGGGASEAGNNSDADISWSEGGDGLALSIDGTATYRGGGGGGGKSSNVSGTIANGGVGGGGNGGNRDTSMDPTVGTANTGGGGGGGYYHTPTGASRPGAAGGSGIVIIRRLTSKTVGGNMTLVSATTAAQAAPTKGDIVFTYTNGAGSTTLGTDVTAEISADGGSTWTAMTLGSEGSTGIHNIATAHDVTITSTITAPWNMAYRIKTLNQTAAKTTRIQAVSLGWS